MLRVKIHSAYRKIVAVSDPELLGKRFEKGNMQLEVKEAFYGGSGSQLIEENKVIELLKEEDADDAVFNFVGKNAVAAGIKAGVIAKEGVMKIDVVQHALGLL